MNDGGLKACVKRGAAYAVLMEGLYPDIRQVYFDPADLDDVVKKLRKGDCHAYVDVRASLEIVAGLSRFCEHGLAMPGEPIASGPQDMAVGVREDLVDVRDALSFWVNVVRTCSPVMPDPACYGQWNVEDMWRHWARDACDATWRFAGDPCVHHFTHAATGVAFQLSAADPASYADDDDETRERRRRESDVMSGAGALADEVSFVPLEFGKAEGYLPGYLSEQIEFERGEMPEFVGRMLGVLNRIATEHVAPAASR